MARTRLQPGDVIAGYTVIRMLGAGGMGTVYLARHPRLPRNQALKILGTGLEGDPSFRERFRREADLAARLDHPNIVSVQDAGVDGDVMWIAMQYVEGTDAAAMVRESRGGLSAAQAADIVSQVAAGLDYAHARGMLHRDVKPANMLVAVDPAGSRSTQRVLVADFGVARLLTESTQLTSTGTMIGTLSYAAPELFMGADLTPAVDEYALGCALFELLTGRTVFTRPDQLSMMHAHANAPVPRVTQLRPDLSPTIDDVIARALAKEPGHRFATCGELAAAASAALTAPSTRIMQPRVDRTVIAAGLPPIPSRPVPSPPVQPPADHPSPGRGRRKPLVAAAIAALVVAALVVAAVIVWLGKDRSGGTVDDTAAPGSPAASSAGSVPPSTPDNPTTTLVGNWRGAVTGDQNGFDVVATISTDAPVYATVSYPQLSCMGSWTEQEPRNGSTVVLAETIATGSCVDSTVTLTPGSDGTLAYRSRYFSQSQNRDFVITATLRRA